MAKEKVSKSQLIRDYLDAHPEAKANDVVAALGENGHKVSANLVYFNKGKTAAKKQRRKQVVKAATAAASGHGVGNGSTSKSDAVTLVRDVKSLAQRAGGYNRLRDLVNALAE